MSTHEIVLRKHEINVFYLFITSEAKKSCSRAIEAHAEDVKGNGDQYGPWVIIKTYCDTFHDSNEWSQNSNVSLTTSRKSRTSYEL